MRFFINFSVTYHDIVPILCQIGKYCIKAYNNEKAMFYCTMKFRITNYCKNPIIIVRFPTLVTRLENGGKGKNGLLATFFFFGYFFPLRAEKAKAHLRHTAMTSEFIRRLVFSLHSYLNKPQPKSFT